jgi:hypothetical protein
VFSIAAILLTVEGFLLGLSSLLEKSPNRLLALYLGMLGLMFSLIVLIWAGVLQQNPGFRTTTPLPFLLGEFPFLLYFGIDLLLFVGMVVLYFVNVALIYEEDFAEESRTEP